MNYLDLSIIIVNWRSRAFLKQCLMSIYKDAHTMTCEIIVVDNASYDGCEQMLSNEFPRVIFIQSRQNLGFAGANNLAFDCSRGQSILFLNPDTEIQGEAIQKLVNSLKSIPDAGMVGARLLNSDFSLQTSCVTAIPSILNQVLNSEHLRKSFPRWRMWGIKQLFVKHEMPVEVEAISGACMVAKRDVLEQVGFFSTNYFMYSEDMDICVKITKAGWKIYYVPDAIIVHHGGSSSASREENNFSSIMIRESLIDFFRSHRGHFYATLYRVGTSLISVIRIFILVIVSPIVIFLPKGYSFLSHGFGKWIGILIWSLGLTKWASQQPRLQ
jgi:N-acetylglucosaminyl-diphospho-decaprenol L-rhamnosyltransferase